MDFRPFARKNNYENTHLGNEHNRNFGIVIRLFKILLHYFIVCFTIPTSLGVTGFEVGDRIIQSNTSVQYIQIRYC